jgi:hypothetical protein
MNPNFLLGIVSALAGFILKTTVAFAVCGPYKARRLAEPKIYSVAAVSLWHGSVLALVGD